MSNRLTLKKRSDQRGVVIVVALFIVALVATLSYVMIARVERDTRRTSLLLNSIQSYHYAQGSVYWAMDQLRNNWELQKPNKPIDVMPVKSPALKENNYQISTIIYDMQARFNVNNLADKKAQIGFTHLLQTLFSNLKDYGAADISRATSEWVSENLQETEFSRYYLKLSLPYRAAHRQMVSLSELRLVKGITPEMLEVLRYYVAALPSGTLLNVQDAEAPVLLTLSPTLTMEGALSIIKERVQKPFLSTKDFSNLNVVKNHHVDEKAITVVSNYFLVETTVSIEKQKLVIYTLLMRTINGRKARVNMLWQSIGAY